MPLTNVSIKSADFNLDVNFSISVWGIVLGVGAGLGSLGFVLFRYQSQVNKLTSEKRSLAEEKRKEGKRLEEELEKEKLISKGLEKEKKLSDDEIEKQKQISKQFLSVIMEFKSEYVVNLTKKILKNHSLSEVTEPMDEKTGQNTKTRNAEGDKKKLGYLVSVCCLNVIERLLKYVKEVREGEQTQYGEAKILAANFIIFRLVAGQIEEETTKSILDDCNQFDKLEIFSVFKQQLTVEDSDDEIPKTLKTFSDKVKTAWQLYGSSSGKYLERDEEYAACFEKLYRAGGGNTDTSTYSTN